MSRGKEMNCQPLSEELEFLTACLIGHGVNIQVKSQLLHGILLAASFDNDYGVLLDILDQNSIKRPVKIVLEDIVYISAQDISLQIDQDSMLKIVTFFPPISHVEDKNGPGPSNSSDQSFSNREESTGLPIRPSMQPTQGELTQDGGLMSELAGIPDVELMPWLTQAASRTPYVVMFDNSLRQYAVQQEPGPEGARYYRLRPDQDQHPRWYLQHPGDEQIPPWYQLPPPPPIQMHVYNSFIVYPNFPQGQPQQHHSTWHQAPTGPPHLHQFDGRGHQGPG